MVDYLSRPRPRRTTSPSAAPRPTRRRLEVEPAAGPRARLLHEDHVRVRPRRTRCPVRHRRRRPLRRAVGGARRHRRCPASVTESASTAPSWRSRPRRSPIGAARAGLRGADGCRGPRPSGGPAGELRAQGVSTDLAYGGRGLKGAMKGADRSGARFALVLGDRRARCRSDRGQRSGRRVATHGRARRGRRRRRGRPARVALTSSRSAPRATRRG